MVPALTNENIQAFLDWGVESLIEGCNSSEDIKNKLIEHDCKGYRRHLDRCPVAQWLWKCCPWENNFTFTVMSVNNRFCTWWGENSVLECVDKPEVTLPFIVRKFINDFDNEKIPELRK